MRRPPAHEGLLGKRIQIQANLLTETPAYCSLDHIDGDLCCSGNMAFVQMSAHYRHVFSAGSDMAVEIGLPVHFRNISNQGSNLHKAGKFRPPILLLLRIKKPQRDPNLLYSIFVPLLYPFIPHARSPGLRFLSYASRLPHRGCPQYYPENTSLRRRFPDRRLCHPTGAIRYTDIRPD